MNFLAIATLKNDRACFRLPISIRPLRSLNSTFESARTGIAMVGSLRFSAAVITRSATPTSFFSTAVGFRGFLAISDPLPLLRLAPGARLRFGPVLRLARRLGFGRRRRRHRLGRRRAVRRHDRHLAFDTLRCDDDRMRQAFGTAAVLPQQLVGLAASGELRGHLQELVLQLRGGESTALVPVERLEDLLAVELAAIAPA